MSEHNEYGSQFEGAVIAIMSLVIVASLLGVAALYSANRPSCRHSDYTYCEPETH